MPTTTEYEFARYLHHAVMQAIFPVVQKIADDIKDSLGVQGPPRSRPGEKPHRESGRLQNSIYASIDPFNLDLVRGFVNTDVPYAARLEKTMDRAFMAPAVERWSTRVAEELAAELAKHL